LARLSTHVLDVSLGKPAEGVRVDVYRIEGDARRHCRSAITNAEGRTAEPLLAGDTLPRGIYELVFAAADYFRERGIPLPDPPFLDQVAIRFGIADERGNYHVPLLLSPYAYSTYRGS